MSKMWEHIDHLAVENVLLRSMRDYGYLGISNEDMEATIRTLEKRIEMLTLAYPRDGVSNDRPDPGED